MNAERYEGPILGIQDGAVYLIEFADSRARVDSFVQLLETEKTSSPRWLIKYSRTEWGLAALAGYAGTHSIRELLGNHAG